MISHTCPGGALGARPEVSVGDAAGSACVGGAAKMAPDVEAKGFEHMGLDGRLLRVRGERGTGGANGALGAGRGPGRSGVLEGNDRRGRVRSVGDPSVGRDRGIFGDEGGLGQRGSLGEGEGCGVAFGMGNWGPFEGTGIFGTL